VVAVDVPLPTGRIDDSQAATDIRSGERPAAHQVNVLPGTLYVERIILGETDGPLLAGDNRGVEAMDR